LTTVRTQVLLSSVRVRDALLATSPSAIEENREEVEQSFHLIQMALEDYEPVAQSATQGAEVLSLRTELDRFHQASVGALGFAPGRSPTTVRDVLNQQVMPRRETALAISEQIQSLNRQAYMRQQVATAAIYEAAEHKSRRQLGIALALSLGVLLLTSLYAATLDARLSLQLRQDARLSSELDDMATQLLAARPEVNRVNGLLGHSQDDDPGTPGAG